MKSLDLQEGDRQFVDAETAARRLSAVQSWAMPEQFSDAVSRLLDSLQMEGEPAWMAPVDKDHIARLDRGVRELRAQARRQMRAG